MAVRRYRVKAGKHHEGGKVYKVGDVLVKEEDLMPDSFKHKFEDLGPVTVSKRVKATSPDQSNPALKMEHRGGGKYRVIEVETGQLITDSLISKEDAEAIITGHGK